MKPSLWVRDPRTRNGTRGGPRWERRAQATFVAAALLLAGGRAASAPPSPGVLLRTARYALAEGDLDSARRSLLELRSREPASARGLEATLLLADVEFSSRRAHEADRQLALAQSTLSTGDGAAQLSLARGWIALALHDPDAARAQFDAAASLATERAGRDLARFGRAWALLLGERAVEAAALLDELTRSAENPVVGAVAGLVLARAESAASRHSRALHALRRARRLARGTRFEDDVELALGLTQLAAGDRRSARQSFARISRAATARAGSSAPGFQGPGLTLDDLRLSPAPLTDRIAALFAERTDRRETPTAFFARLLERDAAADVAQAVKLAADGDSGRGA